MAGRECENQLGSAKGCAPNETVSPASIKAGAPGYTGDDTGAYRALGQRLLDAQHELIGEFIAIWRSNRGFARNTKFIARHDHIQLPTLGLKGGDASVDSEPRRGRCIPEVRAESCHYRLFGWATGRSLPLDIGATGEKKHGQRAGEHAATLIPSAMVCKMK